METPSSSLPTRIERRGLSGRRRGYSLVLINPAANPDHTNPANWRSSASKNGNPGAPKGTTYLAWKTAHNVTDDIADIDRDGLTAFAEYC